MSLSYMVIMTKKLKICMRDLTNFVKWNKELQLVAKKRRRIYIPDAQDALVGTKMLKNITVAPTTKSKAKKPETFMLSSAKTWSGQCPWSGEVVTFLEEEEEEEEEETKVQHKTRKDNKFGRWEKKMSPKKSYLFMKWFAIFYYKTFMLSWFCVMITCLGTRIPQQAWVSALKSHEWWASSFPSAVVTARAIAIKSQQPPQWMAMRNFHAALYHLNFPHYYRVSQSILYTLPNILLFF